MFHSFHIVISKELLHLFFFYWDRIHFKGVFAFAFDLQGRLTVISIAYLILSYTSKIINVLFRPQLDLDVITWCLNFLPILSNFFPLWLALCICIFWFSKCSDFSLMVNCPNLAVLKFQLTPLIYWRFYFSLSRCYVHVYNFCLFRVVDFLHFSEISLFPDPKWAALVFQSWLPADRSIWFYIVKKSKRKNVSIVKIPNYSTIKHIKMLTWFPRTR